MNASKQQVTTKNIVEGTLIFIISVLFLRTSLTNVETLKASIPFLLLTEWIRMLLWTVLAWLAFRCLFVKGKSFKQKIMQRGKIVLQTEEALVRVKSFCELTGFLFALFVQNLIVTTILCLAVPLDYDLSKAILQAAYQIDVSFSSPTKIIFALALIQGMIGVLFLSLWLCCNTAKRFSDYICKKCIVRFRTD